eukprot:6882778-Lingulodinium_polyedra.AAC.1
MPAGSTKPYTTAQAREPPGEQGPSARRRSAACAAARCWIRRMTQCGRDAVTTCISFASRASERRRSSP